MGEQVGFGPYLTKKNMKEEQGSTQGPLLATHGPNRFVEKENLQRSHVHNPAATRSTSFLSSVQAGLSDTVQDRRVGILCCSFSRNLLAMSRITAESRGSNFAVLRRKKGLFS